LIDSLQTAIVYIQICAFVLLSSAKKLTLILLPVNESVSQFICPEIHCIS